MKYTVMMRNGGRRQYASLEDLQKDAERWDKRVTMNSANSIIMPIYRDGDIIGVALGMI